MINRISINININVNRNINININIDININIYLSICLEIDIDITDNIVHNTNFQLYKNDLIGKGYKRIGKGKGDTYHFF